MANTSVIHEYNVLYTDRLVQRDKKWVDGMLKYYEFNNKIEVLNEDGVLIKTDFKKLQFDINKQYMVNNLLIEILEFNGTTERDISMLFKKETSQHDRSQDLTNTGDSDMSLLSKKHLKPPIKKKPIMKREPIKADITPIKTKSPVVKRRLIGTKAANNRAGLTWPSGMKQIQNSGAQKNMAKSTPESPKPANLGLKFKVVKPLIRRVPPNSTKLFRFIE